MSEFGPLDFERGLVSAVIPCRNEIKAIEATVRALLATNHPKIEVLVVDGMSEDGTRDVVKKLMQEDPRVRLVDNPKKLTPYAFNLGVVNARGEFVQIVGSRNVLDPNYIPLLLEALKLSPEVACAGGDYQHVYDSAAGRMISLAMESKFGMGFGNYRTMEADTYVDTVGIPLYHRQIFEKIGMFDEMLTRNQDDEFNFRVRQMGFKIMYVHSAKATYLVRGSLKKAFHQFFQYGYFKVFVNRKHKAVTTGRQMVPAMFLAALVLLTLGSLLPLGWATTIFRALLIWMLIAYILLGMKLAGRDLTLAERFQVVKTCFVLHVGYGYGYWMGIWDFLIFSHQPRVAFQRQTT